MRIVRGTCATSVAAYRVALTSPSAVPNVHDARGRHGSGPCILISLRSLAVMLLSVELQPTMQALLNRKKNANPWVGVFLAAQSQSEVPPDQFLLRNVDQLWRVGTLANIQSIAATPEGLQARV
jgi:hypothetical protein